MGVGRDGSAIDQIGAQLRTMTSGVSLEPTVSYDVGRA